MKVKVLHEAGYEEAALGFSLSYKSTPERAKELFPAKAFIQVGENKFLESIYLWLRVDAPRFWWSQADTYRIATKQSESTMHTIIKRPLTTDDFEYCKENESFIKMVIEHIESIRIDPDLSNKDKVRLIKDILPESFLQERVWVINYKTLQNIIAQRQNHPLIQWQKFIQQIKEQIEHPEFIFTLD